MHMKIATPRQRVLLGLAFAFGLSGFGCGSHSSPVTATPASSHFVATGSLGTARVQHTATLLNNGMVLIAGGASNGPGLAAQVALASAELYNPATGTFTGTGSMQAARLQHTATLLKNGMVLIVGGEDSLSNVLSSVELYNPATGTFSSTGSLITGRDFHTATLLSNGMVLIAGGRIPTGGSSFQGIASAELYDPASGTFTATGNLQTARLDHSATLLNSGMVLIAGGYTSGIGTGTFASAELFNPATGTFNSTGNMSTPRVWHSATLLNSGMVLMAGGLADTSSSSPLASTELFNPTSGTFASSANMTTARAAHSATLLSDGTVLIVGGASSTGALTSAEIYNSAVGTFAATASLNTGRGLHSATLLKSNVLIAGGADFTGKGLASAELFEPASGQLF
jgi:hypothetical protein